MHFWCMKLLIILSFVVGISGCKDNTADDYIREALIFSQNDNSKAAVVALKSALQQAPRSAKARFELGKAQLRLKNFLEASKELSLALEYGYAENQIIPLLAESLARSNAHVALADLTYQVSLLTPAQQLEVGSRKVASLLELSMNDEASVLVNELLLIDISTPYSEIVKGYSFILAKDYQGALNTLKATLERAPYNPDVMSLAARLYVLNGDIDSATKVYESYVNVASDDPQTKFLLIDLLLQQRQFTRAEKYIDELLAISSTNGLLNQLKARARAAANDHVAAKDLQKPP